MNCTWDGVVRWRGLFYCSRGRGGGEGVQDAGALIGVLIGDLIGDKVGARLFTRLFTMDDLEEECSCFRQSFSSGGGYSQLILIALSNSVFVLPACPLNLNPVVHLIVLDFLTLPNNYLSLPI